MKKKSYIKISSLFIKSLVILIFIVLVPIYFILAQLFSHSDLEFDINKYNKIINENIIIRNNNIELECYGKKVLLDNGIWIQFIDNTLNEVYSYNKPNNIKKSYTPLSFIDAYKNDLNKNTVFVFETNINNNEYYYFLGIPSKFVVKHNITFNPNALKIILKNFLIIIIISILIIIIFSYFYFSKKILNPMKEIIEYIFELSEGNYNISIRKSKMYTEVFDCLNKLKETLNKNKIQKENLDKSREKWISYIGHDIKTPLSSIKGFSEIIKNKEYVFTEAEYRSYSNIIYNKSLYIEELVNDLNFTYKIKNCNISLKLEEIDLLIFIKNLTNELLLNPQFEGKNIFISSPNEKILISFDNKLMKRALSNLIINFILYNNNKIKITIDMFEECEYVKIILKDNGRGINQEDLENIFELYFRGTNTKSNPSGSGLGMAIANELIKLHGGSCHIESKINIGTKLEIKLPKNKKIK